jgi:hypothetical protein
MKKYLIFILIILIVIFFAYYLNNVPAVKKSPAGICHQKGAIFYNNTKNFTSYDNLSDCINSGGRLPKK